MTSLSYEEIFSDFLGNVSDYKIASLNISDAYEIMTEYLHKSLRQSYVSDLFNAITCQDEIQTISYELSYIVEENKDKGFILSVLSKAMVIEWLKPQVRNKSNYAQVFGNKEMKYYSQSTHLTELRASLEDTRLELEKEIKERGGSHNSYLEDN